jgi:ATP diphosphatase
MTDELGDVLFALVNYGRHLGIDAEAALRQTNEKFRSRFHSVERGLEEAGSSLDAATLDEMETLCQQAKKAG